MIKRKDKSSEWSQIPLYQKLLDEKASTSENNFAFMKKLLSSKDEITKILWGNTSEEEVKNFIKNIMKKWIKQINKDIIFAESIHKLIKNKIDDKDIEYVTKGQEWEIYKVSIWEWVEEKKYIIIKKNNNQETIQKEANTFEQINNILNHTSTTGLITPEYYGIITDKDNIHYIVMEYIDGKTLYTLQLEKIVDELTKRSIHLHEDHKILQRYTDTNWKVDLINDTIAEEYIMDLITYFSAYSMVLSQYTWQYNKFDAIFLDSVRKKEIFAKIYNDMMNKGKLWIFTNTEAKALINTIKAWLKTLHEHGYYHRDIWWNPRNIMIKKWEDGELQPVLIDFWKTIKYTAWAYGDEYNQWVWPYYETWLHGEWSGYIPDNHVIWYFQSSIIKYDEHEQEEIERKNPNATSYEYMKDNFSTMKEKLQLSLDKIPHFIGKTANTHWFQSFFESYLIYGGTKKAWSWSYIYPLLDIDENKKLLTNSSIESEILKRLTALEKSAFEKMYMYLLEIKESKKNSKKTIYATYFLQYFDFLKPAFL